MFQPLIGVLTVHEPCANHFYAKQIGFDEFASSIKSLHSTWDDDRATANFIITWICQIEKSPIVIFYQQMNFIRIPWFQWRTARQNLSSPFVEYPPEAEKLSAGQGFSSVHLTSFEVTRIYPSIDNRLAIMCFDGKSNGCAIMLNHEMIFSFDAI